MLHVQLVNREKSMRGKEKRSLKRLSLGHNNHLISEHFSPDIVNYILGNKS